ncbi:hypothetical protein COCCU_06225 [Corynebacterium occultum]|uniref:Uncharacterized protein n=1 Tax=Corynebacterium occultum TaxID=2675219 RepID=A0A6B8VVN3_9CORY|nr:DUF2975 domain-containing protein [Corynebacterium occultum]QGU07189.1 hypothetical protein COCCU_06225 [Corynebacterium occultum]
MNSFMLLALRLIFGIAFLGALVVQVVLIVEVIGAPLPGIAMGLLVIAILGCVEVVIFCVFRLLHLVAGNRIFNRQAFRWVDIIAITMGVTAVLMLPLSYIPAELDDAPGLVLIGLLLAMLMVGVALLVYVQRTLLAQAVNRDTQARKLESELEGVI